MWSERIGRVMAPDKMVTASREASVYEVAGLMLVARASAVMVLDDGRLVGIFTERDAVSRVIAGGRDPRAVSVGEVMTHDPITIGPDATFGQAMLLMHERGFRHLPVVEDGHPVGMMSARDALDPDLEEFVCEEARREALR